MDIPRSDDLDYLYVILDTDGNCWQVLDSGTEKVHGMPSLLREGWRPVREVAFQDGEYMLILLDREPRRGKVGFGLD